MVIEGKGLKVESENNSFWGFWPLALGLVNQSYS